MTIGGLEHPSHTPFHADTTFAVFNRRSDGSMVLDDQCIDCACKNGRQAILSGLSSVSYGILFLFRATSVTRIEYIVGIAIPGWHIKLA